MDVVWNDPQVVWIMAQCPIIRTEGRIKMINIKFTIIILNSQPWLMV